MTHNSRSRHIDFEVDFAYVMGAVLYSDNFRRIGQEISRNSNPDLGPDPYYVLRLEDEVSNFLSGIRPRSRMEHRLFQRIGRECVTLEEENYIRQRIEEIRADRPYIDANQLSIPGF